MYERMLNRSHITLANDFSWQASERITKILCITNSTLQYHYPETIARFFPHSKVITFLIPDSETAKSFSWLEKIMAVLMKERFNRDDYTVGFGGGVVCDLAGLAAALYFRGMRCILIPTTLLAQVDAAVGGKTGINFRGVKNAIGTFYFPEHVVLNTAFFKTLTAREYRNGLIELIKYGFIRDYSLVEDMYQNSELLLQCDTTFLYRLVGKAIDIKCSIVENDEQDSDERHVLNFGHTYGHALETATRFCEYKHGEAVGIGILKAFDIAHALGYTVWGFRQDFESFLKTLGIPVTVPAEQEKRVWRYMAYDKKIRNNKIRYIIPVGAGKVDVHEFDSYNDIKRLISY